jgi:hypothetical protein
LVVLSQMMFEEKSSQWRPGSTSAEHVRDRKPLVQVASTSARAVAVPSERLATTLKVSAARNVGARKRPCGWFGIRLPLRRVTPCCAQFESGLLRARGALRLSPGRSPPSARRLWPFPDAPGNHGVSGRTIGHLAGNVEVRIKPLRLLRLVILIGALQKAVGSAIRGRVLFSALM